jgi:chondroitin 4-sulfotransferase 11
VSDREGKVKYLQQALGLIGLPHITFEMWWTYRRHFEPKTAWNDNHRAFFIHIPKTAGTSIYDSLGMEKLPYTHAPARILRGIYPCEYAEYFSFAFVRNPWDRLVSTFEFLKIGTVWPEQKEWALRHIGDQSFRDFVIRLERDQFYRATIFSYNFFYTQMYFVSDRSGKIIVDRVFRFEDVEAGFEELAARFGQKRPLSHIRKTQGRLRYESYYDAETWDIVGNLYAKDVQMFDYQRTPWPDQAINAFARHTPVTLAADELA